MSKKINENQRRILIHNIVTASIHITKEELTAIYEILALAIERDIKEGQEKDENE